jgi:AcrR family transcriptional regulator
VDWRQRKRTETRRVLREHALRLFSEQGYDETTVAQIVEAAGVSHMTFFRYFATKDDVVAATDFDFDIEGLIRSRPDDDPVDRVRAAFRAGLTEAYLADRDTLLVRTRLLARTPALRARMWENHNATLRLVERGLGGAGRPTFGTRILAAACLSTMVTALLTWADRNGVDDLPDLVDEAFAALADGVGGGTPEAAGHGDERSGGEEQDQGAPQRAGKPRFRAKPKGKKSMNKP